MPIFFERTDRGESPVLSIYGTKEDLTRFAKDLEAGIAFQNLTGSEDPKVRVSNLRSSTFESVEILAVTETEMLAVERSAKRKKLSIIAIWVLLLGAVIFVLIKK